MTEIGRGSKRKKRWRMWRRVTVLVVLLAVALAGLGFPVYVHPQEDRLRHADAILVLGGNGLDRYTYGLQLAEEGYSSNVLFSNPYGPDTSIDEVREPCKSPPPGIDLECFAPDPPTTKGEARELGRIAKERGWNNVIVVTFVPHISRARYILEKCYPGNLIMVPSHTGLSLQYWAWTYIYQSAGYVRAFLDGGC